METPIKLETGCGLGSTMVSTDRRGTQLIQRVYSRLNWQYSQYLGTRIIAQTVHSNQEEARALDSLFGSFLISYIRNPGNEVYVGATWNWTPDPDVIPTQPNVFLQTIYCCNNKCCLPNGRILFQY